VVFKLRITQCKEINSTTLKERYHVPEGYEEKVAGAHRVQVEAGERCGRLQGGLRRGRGTEGAGVPIIVYHSITVHFPLIIQIDNGSYPLISMRYMFFSWNLVLKLDQPYLPQGKMGHFIFILVACGSCGYHKHYSL